METNESKSVEKKANGKSSKKSPPPPLSFEPLFGKPRVRLVKRTADIRGKENKSIFYAENLEFPEDWSQNAVNITADKYFRSVEQEDGTRKRETSVIEMVDRVVGTIEKWGLTFGHFKNADEAEVFGNELRTILVMQRASFNSPVWFNIGTKRGRLHEEQASACFINSIDDDMLSILQTSVVEGMLYKGGSGSGINYSPLRSSRELLSGGGTASGPVPFIASHDANGGAIKSGGGTRRAAKMNILNADHGDILEFIDCKADAEKKARALIAAGFDSDFRARLGVYQSVPFQNANHSVRVTDSFMHAVEKDGLWNLMARDGVTVLETLPARTLWARICDAAWECGDPGLQFDTMINHMHTIPADGRINASNPCSEYMSIDDSACNLASLNLMKFRNDDGSFDLQGYLHTVDVMITAMDILVDGASYPTEKIGINARKFRQLGLGYANLGALLMNMGLAYDSAEGRYVAGLLTAILCGRAYQRSAVLAAHLEPFEGFARNRSAMLDVMKSHYDGIEKIHDDYVDAEGPLVDFYEQLAECASRVWSLAITLGKDYGFRNSQATVMAPTGTIAFMMDCDTTGIEPETALVKHKKLVGGGAMKIVNQGVHAALERLGYDDATKTAIVAYVEANGSAVGSGLREEHLPIFDTSFAENVAKRALRPEAHVLMLAAIQPFVSGAISKTCNLPETATREDISEIYLLAWKKGLKAVALYRDNCKGSQPLSTTKEDVAAAQAQAPATVKLLEENLQYIEQLKLQIADLQEQTQASRRKLPDERQAITHKFRIASGEMEVKVYLTCGLYPDGSLGEIFLKSDKEGSLVSGLLDSIATLTSFSLQYGVPLSSLTRKFRRVAFEPHGWTGNPEIKYASSILDYVFRFLDLRFGSKQPTVEVQELTETVIEIPKSLETRVTEANQAVLRTVANGGHDKLDARNGKHLGERVMKRCPQCDGIMYRTGSCTTCSDCGTNTGCA